MLSIEKEMAGKLKYTSLMNEFEVEMQGESYFKNKVLFFSVFRLFIVTR